MKGATMLNHRYDPESDLTPDDLYPNSLTLYGFSEFKTSALVEALRNRFDDRSIRFVAMELGAMVVLPETITSARTEQIRLYAEGFVAALEWGRR
jgi:hypothetical protein